MIVAHRRTLTWSKEFTTMPLGWLLGILIIQIVVEFTSRNHWISILSVIVEINFLHHWCLKPFLGLHQPTFLIVMSWILMLMVMTPEDQIWIYISQPCVKTCIEIVLCIWVANRRMIYPSLCNILRVLNHLNIITKCTSWSLAHDFSLLWQLVCFCIT